MFVFKIMEKLQCPKLTSRQRIHDYEIHLDNINDFQEASCNSKQRSGVPAGDTRTWTS